MAKASAKKTTKPRRNNPTRAEERRAAKLLKRLKNDYRADWRADKTWRKNKVEDEAFYDGDMWTPEEKRILEERGQAAVVINRIKPKIDAISGMQMAMAVDTKVFPRGLRDYAKANHMSTALRYIEQTSDFDSAENDAFEDVLKSGRAWYKTFIEWRNFEPQIRTIHLDNDSIVPDKNSKKADHSDAKCVNEHVDMESGDFNEIFPGHEEKLKECFTDEGKTGWDSHRNRKPDQYKDSPNTEDADDEDSEEATLFVNKERKLIRVIVRQERQAYYQRVLFAPGVGTMDITKDTEEDIGQFLAEFPDAQEFTQLRYRLNQYTFIDNVLMEEKLDISPWDDEGQLWYTKTVGYREKKNRVDYGLVRQMKDSNREINKRRAKLLHELSTKTVIRSEGAVEDPEDAREELHKADGDIVVRDGQRFEVLNKTEATQGQLLMLQQSDRELEQAGAPRELEGISGAGESGRGFALKQQSQVAGLRRLYRNQRGSRLVKSRLEMKFVQYYWTDEMVLKVTDDPEAPAVLLNQLILDPYTGAPVLDAETGEPMKMNDLSQGDYDLIVEESPEYINLESETFAQMSALAMKGFPIPPELLLSIAPIPDREKWIKKIGEHIAMQQQQLQAAQAAKAGAGNVPEAAVG